MKKRQKKKLVRFIKFSAIAIGLLGISVAALTFENYTPPAEQAVTAPVPAPTVTELLTEVNKAREGAGINPLVKDDRLDGSAQTKAHDMLINGYGHTDRDGKQGYEYAKAAMPECYTVSENIDAAQTAAEAVNEWLSSPEHKAALMDSKYVFTGFGIAPYEDYFYIVQHFCQPQPQQTRQPTALCEDGSPSYSQSRSGTCSHHGGVAEWYY